ncbi:50S ribosomal protein L35 [Euzebya tangerina]|uniref:50S ribosomal protein L35 n=1 Tax=Euzebya tangerina TaxID=591198 RepID=UPI000E3236AF|nr:50S ribosomal protein L35 [Euzebya tangerina]
MPKQKTHSGSKDRFRVTRTGKVMHRRQNRNHLAEHKPQRRKLRLRRDEALSSAKEARNIKRMLGQ